MSEFYIADVRAGTGKNAVNAQIGSYNQSQSLAEHFLGLEALSAFPKVNPAKIVVSNVRPYDREAFINSNGLVD
jgi:hypothetical protein